MGRTEVTATITGPMAEKEFTFLVAPGAVFVGLPAADIAELGLTPIPNGRRRFVTANGVVERDTYGAYGRLEEQGFLATVMEAPIPHIGCQLLENLGFTINAGTHEVIPRGTDLPGPPYLISQWLDS